MEVQKEKRVHRVIRQPFCGKYRHHFLYHLPLGKLLNIFFGLGFLICKRRPLKFLLRQYFFKLILIQDATL